MTPELHEAITALVDWYDQHLDGQQPTVEVLDQIVKDLQAQQPYPQTPVGLDVQFLANCPPNADRNQLVDAIERLRLTPLTLL